MTLLAISTRFVFEDAEKNFRSVHVLNEGEEEPESILKATTSHTVAQAHVSVVEITNRDQHTVAL